MVLLPPESQSAWLVYVVFVEFDEIGEIFHTSWNFDQLRDVSVYTNLHESQTTVS